MAVIGYQRAVYFIGSSTPDLLIGLIIALLVARGAVMILREARAPYTNLYTEAVTGVPLTAPTREC